MTQQSATTRRSDAREADENLSEVLSKKNIREVYRLSPRQRELLQATPSARQMLVTLEGSAEPALLPRAWSILVERHPILRTVFYPGGKSEPLQLVLRQRSVAMADGDLRGLAAADRERRLADLVREDGRDFDPARGPLVRLRQVVVSDRRRWLLWSWHPIILDRRSVRLLTADLLAVCEALRGGEPPPPAEFSPFREYVLWLDHQDLEATRRFWHRHLQDVAMPTPLPANRRPEEPSAGAQAAPGRWSQRIEATLGSALARLAARLELAPETIWQAAWGVLLMRFSGEPEALWGLDAGGWPTEWAGGESMLGPLACTLPVRLQAAVDTSLPDLLDEVEQQRIELAHHAYLSAAEIRAASPIAPPQPLFASRVGLREEPPAGAGALRPVAEEQPGLRADGDCALRLEVIPGEAPEIVLRYLPELFDVATVTNLGQCFAALLESFVATPEARVSDLEMLPATQRRQLLEEFNCPQPPPSRANRLDRFAHQLFEDQVAARPDAVAVVADGATLSYGELNRRANQRAHWLRARGLGRDDRVAVLSPRGPELVAMVLGIAKAGAAYLPLDDGHPDARLRAILADGGARVLAMPASLARRGQELAASLPVAPVLLLWGGGDPLAGRSTENPSQSALAHDLANVFYTSGSTGQPKGVMIAQAGMLNHLWAKIDLLGLDAGSVVAHNAAVGFDISVWQMLAPLVAGGRVVIYDREAVTDPESFLARIARDRVTVLETVPSLLSIMLPAVDPKLALPALRYLVSNAETLPVSLACRWLERFPNVALLNTYGATECADDTTHQVLSAPPPPAALRIPVGRPIAGFRIYVLDDWLRPVAVGCPGQIAMAGVGVGRGYLGDPRKTGRAFVPDPFAATPGGRLYLSGDLGRWRPGGELEFLGRRDRQVKVRGQRLELGEIEAALMSLSGVRQAAVAAWPDAAGANRLAAYAVVEPGLRLDAVRDDLRRRLPAAMVPEDWLLLESLPTNRHGKIDRRALPRPEQAVRVGAGGDVVAPRNALEAEIASVWQEVLEIEPIGAEDDFFALGGQSLKAIRVRSLIKHRLGIELPLRFLFDYPVLADLALQVRALRERIPGGEAENDRGIPILPEADHYALSHAQRRLWFAQQVNPTDVAYNMTELVALEGPLKPEVFQRSFAALVRRHPGLHTAFRLVDQEPRQRIVPADEVDLDLTDLSELGEEEQEARLRALVTTDAGTAFTLDRPPVRARLVKLARNRHALLLVLHHIITDRWSWDLLWRDLTAIYEASVRQDDPALPPLPIRYVDYAAWQNDRLRTGELAEAEQYWLQQLGGELPELELPCDRPRPQVPTARAGTATLALDPTLGRRLRQLGEAHGATLFMTVLASTFGFLFRLTGQSDVLMGTPVSNRDHVDTEEVVGFFVNMLVIRLAVGEQWTVRELVEHTRRTVVDAYAHQQYPFDLLVRRINPVRELTRSPIFSLTFAIDVEAPGAGPAPGTSSGLILKPREVDNERGMPFDLSILVWGTEDGLRCTMGYARDLFEPATVERLLGCYRTFLEGVAIHPETRITSLPWWSAADREAFRLRQLPEREIYPLTFPQRDAWFQAQQHPHYTACLEVGLRGRLRGAELAEALRTAVDRHVGLRATFPVVDYQPVQRLGPARPGDWIEVDLSALGPGSRHEALSAWRKSMEQMPFDLARGPLSRFGLARLSASEFVLVLVFHHLVIDGANLLTLLQQAFEVYLDRRQLPAPRIRYPDFALWLDARLKAGVLAPDRAYWRRRLAGLPLTFELPGDRPRPAARSFATEEVTLCLPQQRLEALKALRERLGSSVFRTALAVLKLLLCRLIGSRDVVVVTPISIRPPELDDVIGYFANALPLRSDLAGNPSFVELVKRVDTTVREAVDHGSYPLGEVFGTLKLERGADRPLLPIGCSQTHSFHRESEAITISSGTTYGPNVFDLLVFVGKHGNGLKVDFNYSSALYDRVTIERLAASFEALVGNVVSDPEARLSELGILARSERERILFEFNRNVPRSPRPRSVDRWFEQQAARRPEAVAVVCGRERFSYGAINAEANRIAHWLRSRGLGREDRVGLFGRRGPGMLATILGVLQGGAAFVPLDPGNPDQRLRSILDTAKLRWIATQQSLAERARELARATSSQPGILCWDEMLSAQSTPDRDEPDRDTGSHDLACVFYTSGSTGVPKGAMIEHAGMLNHLAAKIELLELDAASAVIQNASHCFDICVWQFLAALLVGGRVHIYADELALDPWRLLVAAERDGATVLETVPSFLRAMLEAVAQRPHAVALRRLETLISNAETLPPALGRQWFERFPHVALINTYGATECSDDTTHHVMTGPPDTSLVAVGRSIPGLRHYVLDPYLEPLPVGFPGAIAIAGVGVGRGYLADPMRSAQSFVPDPFASEPGSRCYLTGDLGRWRDDGLLEFLDRLDHQVKVRGYRIELREVEAALRTHPNVRAGVVVTWETEGGDHSLVAYAVWDGEPDEIHAVLGRHLRGRLPEYMVPAAFVNLEELPLLPNGKVDRRALPRPGPSRSAGDSYVPPRDPIEEAMVEIWEEVLGLRELSVTADFFALGGHSLKAAALVNRVAARFAVEVPVSALFEAPTAAGLSRLVRRLLPGQAQSAAVAGSLVPLRLADSPLPPLFLVHPHAGEVFPYYALARAVDGNRSIYGLRSRGLDGSTETLPGSLEEMASHYADEIRRVRPHGPYHLAGWSFGGLVVHEMAKVLEAAGETVELLAILDAGPVEQPFRPEEEVTVAEVAEMFFQIDRSAFTGLDRRQSLALILERARGNPLLVEGTSLARLDTLIRVIQANTAALWAYRTEGRVAADLHLFQATVDSHLPEPRQWRCYTRGKLHLTTIPGDHHHLVAPPAVAELAAGLNRALAHDLRKRPTERPTEI